MAMANITPIIAEKAKIFAIHLKSFRIEYKI